MMKLSTLVRHASLFSNPTTWGGLTLVKHDKQRNLALVFDRRQSYIIITGPGRWHEGTWQTLGTIGRENALREFEAL